MSTKKMLNFDSSTGSLVSLSTNEKSRERVAFIEGSRFMLMAPKRPLAGVALLLPLYDVRLLILRSMERPVSTFVVTLL